MPTDPTQVVDTFEHNPTGRKVIRYEIDPSGTAWHADTAPLIRRVLSTYLHASDPIRLRVHYGDTETGRDWCDLYSMEGCVSRSTGRIKVPLLIHNARSGGGFPILDNCIVRIRFANRSKGGDLYRHPSYHLPEDFQSHFPHDHEQVYKRHFA